MVFVPTLVIYKYSYIFLCDARPKTELCDSHGYSAFQTNFERALFFKTYLKIFLNLEYFTC